MIKTNLSGLQLYTEGQKEERERILKLLRAALSKANAGGPMHFFEGQVGVLEELIAEIEI